MPSAAIPDVKNSTSNSYVNTNGGVECDGRAERRRIPLVDEQDGSHLR